MKIYTEEELKALEREDLLNVAGEYNVTQSGRGSVIIAAILEAQAKLADAPSADDTAARPVASQQDSHQAPTDEDQKELLSDDTIVAGTELSYKYRYFTKSGNAMILGGRPILPEVFTEDVDDFLENWVGSYLEREDLS